MLWGAFGGLALLTAGGVALTIAVLRMEQRFEQRLVQQSRPFMDAVNQMDDSLALMVSASRGYLSSGDSSFSAQYEDASRNYDEAEKTARDLSNGTTDIGDLNEFRVHAHEIKDLLNQQNQYRDDHRQADAENIMLRVAQKRRVAPDYAGNISNRLRTEQRAAVDEIAAKRQWVMMAMVLFGVGFIGVGLIVSWRIEQRLGESIARQVRRTETMIAGMADGVLLVDGEGRTVFINPAGQRLLGRKDVGVPITQHAKIYHLCDEHGRTLDPEELPAAQALSTGKAVNDTTIIISRAGSDNVAVSMSATPLEEDGRTSGVVVTFRDITERRKLEEQMQVQAERAQILADAGAFFSSNIDPNWVNQAIAERVAEVLGDWAAVILRDDDSKELSVASIYHRDMASLGLAWSYIYRQPLVVGEGIIGQVVSTGYPSLTTNVRARIGQEQVRHVSPVAAEPGVAAHSAVAHAPRDASAPSSLPRMIPSAR